MRLKIKHDSKYEAAASLSIIVELFQLVILVKQDWGLWALFSNKLVTSEIVTKKCIDLHDC